jgi:hypothetical protein
MGARRSVYFRKNMILFLGFLLSLFSGSYYSGGDDASDAEWEFEGEYEPDEWEKEYDRKHGKQ